MTAYLQDVKQRLISVPEAQWSSPDGASSPPSTLSLHSSRHGELRAARGPHPAASALRVDFWAIPETHKEIHLTTCWSDLIFAKLVSRS